MAEASTPPSDPSSPSAPSSGIGERPGRTIELSRSVVPVEPPRLPEPGRRPGLWRRLMGRRDDGLALGIEGAGRLRAIEDRMSGLERHLDERIGGLEEQLTQFWAIDERLGKLEEIETAVAELRETQVRLISRLERNGRALRLLALFAVLAAAAALALVLN
jgi:hypothetical protein